VFTQYDTLVGVSKLRLKREKPPPPLTELNEEADKRALGILKGCIESVTRVAVQIGREHASSKGEDYWKNRCLKVSSRLLYDIQSQYSENCSKPEIQKACRGAGPAHSRCLSWRCLAGVGDGPEGKFTTENRSMCSVSNIRL
jgi:hypothetical protein